METWGSFIHLLAVVSNTAVNTRARSSHFLCSVAGFHIVFNHQVSLGPRSSVCGFGFGGSLVGFFHYFDSLDQTSQS